MICNVTLGYVLFSLAGNSRSTRFCRLGILESSRFFSRNKKKKTFVPFAC